MASFYDYYQVLGLDPGSSKAEIKKAYRTLAQQWHPDKFAHDPAQLNQAQAKFALIKEAYEQLIQLDAFEPESSFPKVSVDFVSADKYYQDGVAYLQVDSYTQAIASFTQAIRKQPDYLDAYRARAFALEKLGFNLQAEADFTKAAELQTQPQPSPTAPESAPSPRPPWRCIHSVSSHKAAVSAMALTPDGSKLVTGSHDQTLKIWNPQMGRVLKTLKGHDRAICTVAVSGDGKLIASAGVDQTIRIWAMHSGKQVQVLRSLFSGHSDTITALAFHPNSPLLISASQDWTVRLWDLNTGKEIEVLKHQGEAILALAVNPTGKAIAYGGTGKHLTLRSLKTGKARLLPIQKPPVLSIAFSPEGDRLAAGYGNEILLWDCDRKKTIAKLKGHHKPVSALAFGSGHQVLVSGSHDKTIQRWQGGERVETLSGHRGEILALACNSDGQMIISGSADKTVKIWQRA
ncbi:MAG: DnaJ domain-containing protein [Leptolyngbyaceae cyanobacterium]